MKRSSKVLFLAMILGLLAWVLDAWFAARVIGGVPFLQSLLEGDPERTLYVRAIVVLMIFVFGMYAGFLLLQMEKLQLRHADAMEKVQAMAQAKADDQASSQAAIQASEARLKDFYAKASMGIFHSQLRDGKILEINPAMAEAVGCSSVEEGLAHYPNAHLLYWDPQDRVRLIEQLRNRGLVEHMDLPIRRKDGSKGWLRVDAHLQERPEEGEPVIMGFARDISDLKRAEALQLELNTQVQNAQKLESIGSLAGGFAHEFNNILQGMIGTAYLAELQAGSESPLRSSFQDIQKSGQRAAKLCDQMLTFAGKKSVILRQIKPDEEIKKIQRDLQKGLPESIELYWELAAPHLAVQADLSMLRELLQHLVTNSADAMSSTGGRLDILSGVKTLASSQLQAYRPMIDRAPGLYYCLDVVDTGSGIDSKEMQRIFDPFYTTKFQGRGLGLAAVLGIVKSFRGGVQVESRLGSGTRFRMVFPAMEVLAPAALPPSGYTEAKFQPVPISPRAERRLIWVVDDEALICATLSKMLSAWGFQVKTALNAEEFLPQFGITRPDTLLVLLDLTIPGMNGHEIFAEIRLLDEDIPVVMISGYSQEQTESYFEAGQISGFLHKPFTIESLYQLVRQVLPAGLWGESV